MPAVTLGVALLVGAVIVVGVVIVVVVAWLRYNMLRERERER